MDHIMAGASTFCWCFKYLLLVLQVPSAGASSTFCWCFKYQPHRTPVMAEV
jgi:hypothetical protein